MEFYWETEYKVMTPLPPKQGLKQPKKSKGGKMPGSYDTTSTKTRIETFSPSIPSVRAPVVMTPLPPKQGLKRAEAGQDEVFGVVL